MGGGGNEEEKRVERCIAWLYKAHYNIGIRRGITTSKNNGPIKLGISMPILCSLLAHFLSFGSDIVVVHVSLTTVTWVRFRLHAIIKLKLPQSHVRRVLSSLTLPSIAGFLWVLRFPPVVTMYPRGGPYWTSRETVEVADRVIQYK